MAEINFTQGGFRGRLGVHIGERSKSKQIIRLAPLIAPHQSVKQTASVRAFEKLNRVAGAMARTNFSALGLKAGRMNKHNAVAKILAPLLENYAFSWSNFEKLGKIDDSVEISEFFEEDSKKAVSIIAKTSVMPEPKRFRAWWVLVLDSEERVVFCACPNSTTLSAQFLRPVFSVGSLHAVAFRTERKAGALKFFGLARAPTNLIENGVLFASRSVAPNGWRVENNTLFASNSVASVKNKTLFAF